MHRNLVKMLTNFVLLFLVTLQISASPLSQQRLKHRKNNIKPLMVHSNNYDMIMPDGAHSWQLQNFASFSDSKMPGNTDFNMDEVKFVPKTAEFRPPQPLTKKEREIRQNVEVADSKLEKLKMLKLKKGKTEPRGANAYPWDQFDYDLFSVNPSNQKHL